MASSVINYRPQLIKLKKMYIYVTIDWKLKREKALTIEGLFHQFVRTSISCFVSQQFVRNGKSVFLKLSTANRRKTVRRKVKTKDWTVEVDKEEPTHLVISGNQVVNCYFFLLLQKNSVRKMEKCCWLKIWFNRMEKWKPSLGRTQDGGLLTQYRFLFYSIVQVYQEKGQNPYLFIIDFERKKRLTTGDWPFLWPSRRPSEGSGTQIFCKNIVLFQENHDIMNHESAIYQFDSFESTGLCLPAERIAWTR